MRLEVFSSRSRGLGIDSRLETRDFQRGGCFFFLRIACAAQIVFERIRKDFMRSRLVRASHSVARTTRTPTSSSYLPPPTFLVPAERRGQPLSSRALQDARSRRGVASDGSRVARKQSFQRKLSRARALRPDARDARRERRGRRVVTRARRARRARLRASRPVAARAASRTRFGTSSRRVSVKARREACFTRFAFSRVLFFRLGFGFRLSRV